DLGVRALVADRVHEPRGLERQQTDLLDLDPRLGDPVADDALLAQRLAEGHTLVGARDHQLEAALRDADEAHAVVDAAGPETRLGDREALALAGDQVAGRDAHVGEDDLGVTAVVAVVVAEDLHAALDLDTGGVPGHEDLRLLAVTRRVRVGLAHDDHDLGVRVHRSRDEPLAAVDDVLVTVAHDR